MTENALDQDLREDKGKLAVDKARISVYSMCAINSTELIDIMSFEYPPTRSLKRDDAIIQTW